MSSSDITRFIFEIIITSGLAVGIFKLWGENWLSNKFAKNLEDHKAKINSLFNRISKIHEKEFEVLPDAWCKLQDAMGHVSNLADPLKQYPDLNRMTQDQLEGFLNKSRLRDDQKKGLLKENDKTKNYMDSIFWHELDDAISAVSKFHNYLLYNKIFLSIDLFDLFKKVDDLLNNAIVDQELGTKFKDFKMKLDYYKKTKKDIEPIVLRIESLVQDRLHYDKA